jgi:hypothetical protein
MMDTIFMSDSNKRDINIAILAELRWIIEE